MSAAPWQVMHGSAPQDMMNDPEKYNWDGSLKELIMPEDLGENEHIERLKEQAKMIGLPWQYMHGSGPPEMMDKPHRYNWDGSLKPPPEEPCEWCERYGDDCYCGTDKRHYGEHDYGNMLIGTVKSVDSVTRYVVLSNCVSSPGNGVGYDLDPEIELTVVMKPRIKLPVSGSVIAVRTPHEIDLGQYQKCWWMLEF